MTGCYIAVTKAVEWCGEKKILNYDKLDSNSITISYTVIVVQSLSCVELFATPWTAAHQASPSFTISWSLLKLKLLSIESVIPSRHLILSPPSPPALKLSQHQGLFHWVSSSHQVAKGLEFQLQLSVLPVNIQDWFPLGWTCWSSLQSKELSRVFSNTTVQKHQFFGSQPSL